MERQLPKNVTQIGNVCDEPKIYIEDYVDTYLGQLREKATEEAVAAALAGEITTCEGQVVVYISGAIEMKDIKVGGSEISISEETRKEIEKDRQEYFPEEKIIGWCLLETGHSMSLNRGAGKLHEQLFKDENTVFLWKDASEKDEMFFAYKYGDLMQIGGHYIYYEKNPAMQNYMIKTRRKNGLTPSEVVEDLAAKNFRNTVREKLEIREQHQNSRTLYVTSLMLVLVVLAIGISTMNNFERMESVQDSLESLSESVSSGDDEKKAKDSKEKALTAEADQKSGEISISEEESSSGDTEVTSDTEQLDDTKAVQTGSVPEVSTVQEDLKDADYYTVRKGDTLASISMKQYGDSRHVDAICRMNGLSDGNLIFIGQKLLLP